MVEATLAFYLHVQKEKVASKLTPKKKKFGVYGSIVDVSGHADHIEYGMKLTRSKL